jgi:hypothetical protein
LRFVLAGGVAGSWSGAAGPAGQELPTHADGRATEAARVGRLSSVRARVYVAGRPAPAVDTGWLLVGVAGIAGGLALVLAGAGLATAPLLLPVGLLLAVVAHLAWTAGSSRIVETVYADVGDPRREAGARTGRPGDRTDPDGGWRSTAADGGQRTGTRDAGGDGVGSRDAGGGLGPGDEQIWDARERDRVGGWDDWEADWEWADRHWQSFQREYGDADWAEGSEGQEATAHTGSGDARGRRGAESRAGAREQTRGGGARSRHRTRERSRRTGPGERGCSRRMRQSDRRGRQARDVLGVSADADAEAIREAYRDRVKEDHPDRGGDPETFKRVQWAYEYLSES